ncbi:conserved hypothetical protein (plasmid) [Sinorhizobium fredii NGR234]|uniref:Uncharacterized protein n=1 Tax=Sinorhizobium fredii (strain NBRC 101917 / NGR234) TaxID=394 RepID=C3KQW9_SINFN|nr:hypothetical protein [Sinorhizobium fredii]ACP22477.1 conserved hypothetical protein [Sinorhizobium fredii NGR234]
MKNLLIRTFLSTIGASSAYLVSDGIARADDWGCEVILCLSNPGGATQYAPCRPPIQRLWRELARGHGLPTCNGVGFSASRPRYEPYACGEGFRLTTRTSDRGAEASCVSTTPQTVANSECDYDQDGGPLSPRWYHLGGQRQCRRYVTRRPSVRSKPHHVDLTIDGIGTQRVWY